MLDSWYYYFYGKLMHKFDSSHIKSDDVDLCRKSLESIFSTKFIELPMIGKVIHCGTISKEIVMADSTIFNGLAKEDKIDKDAKDYFFRNKMYYVLNEVFLRRLDGSFGLSVLERSSYSRRIEDCLDAVSGYIDAGRYGRYAKYMRCFRKFIGGVSFEDIAVSESLDYAYQAEYYAKAVLELLKGNYI